MNPGVYGVATPVRPDGGFEIARVPASVKSLAVFAVLHGGGPILLGEYPIGAGSDLVVAARRVTFVFEEEGPPGRSLLLSMPVDSQGRSAGQWIIPSSAKGVLELGIVPDVIQSAQLLVNGRGRAIEFPASGECLVRIAH
jgi:hypothetical protein